METTCVRYEAGSEFSYVEINLMLQPEAVLRQAPYSLNTHRLNKFKHGRLKF
jgi:hypothetical protein